jgi:hypothetical protein
MGGSVGSLFEGGRWNTSLTPQSGHSIQLS